jgi:hypothetical protein
LYRFVANLSAERAMLLAVDDLYRWDSANEPYEVEPYAAIIANLTCNPGIVYDLFINNPESTWAASSARWRSFPRELRRILGPA